MNQAPALNGLLEKARQCFLRGQSRDARTLCQQALRLAPRHLPTLLLLGGIEGAAGNFKAAKKTFADALALAPGDAMIHFNLGLCAQHLKRPEDARRRYLQAIALRPDFAEAHSNLAATLKDMGRSGDAIDHYRQALRLKPGLASASNNLGILLVEADLHDEAEACFEQALACEPNFVEALNNLGGALIARGLAAQAIEPLRKAIALRPDYPEAHRSMGRALMQLGRAADAARHFERLARARPDDAETLVQYGQALAESGRVAAALSCFERAMGRGGEKNGEALHALAAMLAQLDPEQDLAAMGGIATAVERCLAARFNDHQSLAPIAFGLVFPRETRTRIDAWSTHRADDDDGSWLSDPIVAEIVNNPIFRQVMQRAFVTDIFVERFLARLRRSLLRAIVAQAVPPALRALATDIAYLLAMQAFLNEYVWPVEADEGAAIAALRTAVQTLAPRDPGAELPILVLACYARIGEGTWPDGWLAGLEGAASKRLREIHRIEVESFAIEADLAAAMPALTTVRTGTSELVRSQYETYPYPRWQSLPRTAPVPLPVYLRHAIWPHRPEGLPDLPAPRILIAGCGTGHQAVLAATRYKNASILAIDLSRASLAYASRMADRLGVTNIRFAQGDILDLDHIGETFDVVESVGVLHHMENPARGLESIVAATTPGGLLRIGLYSEIARRGFESLHTRLGIAADRVQSPAEIRALRARVIELAETAGDSGILSTLDFYTTAMVKDLLFHVCEHSFTIPRLADLFQAAGLQFLGFEFPDRRVKRDYLDSNPGDPRAIDLAAWHRFEENHPRTFLSMYVAWLRRTAPT